MYNNVGIRTPRGSGTSGHVMSNRRYAYETPNADIDGIAAFVRVRESQLFAANPVPVNL